MLFYFTIQTNNFQRDTNIIIKMKILILELKEIIKQKKMMKRNKDIEEIKLGQVK